MKPRVLIIHHSGLVGGAGKSLMDLWSQLEKHNDVTVLLPDSPDDLLNMMKAHGRSPKTFSGRLGKHPYYSGGESLMKPRFWLYVMLAAVQLIPWRRRISREEPDIVILNSGVLAWMSFAIKNAVKILYVRETAVGRERSFVNGILSGLRKRFDAVCYLSEFDMTKDSFDGVKILARDAVEPEEFAQPVSRESACKHLGVRHDRFNVLYLGGSNRLKGYDTFIESGLLLRGYPVQLLAAGYPGPSPTGMRRFIPGMGNDGIPPSVRQSADLLVEEEVLKYIGLQQDISAAYSACDVLVFPMSQPHQARPIFEAGFYHLPVVVSDFSNIHGCLKDGVNGILVEPEDAEDLAEAILRLMRDPLRRRRMGRANETHAYKDHAAQSAFRPLDSYVRKMALRVVN